MGLEVPCGAGGEEVGLGVALADRLAELRTSAFSSAAVLLMASPLWPLSLASPPLVDDGAAVASSFDTGRESPSNESSGVSGVARLGGAE